jgi:hypothetical protein
MAMSPQPAPRSGGVPLPPPKRLDRTSSIVLCGSLGLSAILLAIVIAIWASGQSKAKSSADIGTEVRDGSFGVTVTGTSSARQIGAGFSVQRPTGRFFEVHVTIRNASAQPAVFDAAGLTLLVGDEPYLPRFDADPALPSPIQTIGPGGKVPLTVIYDVPVAAKPTSLQIPGPTHSDKVTVQLRP